MTLDLTLPWDRFPIAVADVETTGLDPSKDHVCDFAVVRFEGGKIVDSFASLIKPPVSIPAECSAIHGITDEMVSDAPSFAEVAPQILKVASGAVPCAYNSTFDRAFLHAVITGTECPMFDPAFPGWICPLVAVREVDRYVAGSGRHKLEATCKRWGVQLDGAHRALSDATATGHLLFRLLERRAIRSCSLGSMLKTTEQKRAQQERDFQAWLASRPARDGEEKRP